MGMVKFIHAADLHLDSPLSGLGVDAPEIRDQLREATFGALRNMVDLAIRRQVDFVVLAGDVFDVADRSLAAQIRLRDELTRLGERNIPTFIAHGNHDHCQGWRASLQWPPQVHFFASDQVERLPVIKNETRIAEVYGISHAGPALKENLARQFRRGEGKLVLGASSPWSSSLEVALGNAAEPVPAIAVLHANLGGATGHEDYAPCRLEDLARGRMDYWALGHVHNRTEVEEQGVCAVYPGNTQGRNIKERGEKGCYLITIDGQRVIGREFIPLHCWRWELVQVDASFASSLQEIEEAIKAALEDCLSAAAGSSVIARIEVTGRSQVHRELVRKGTREALLLTLREFGLGLGAAGPGLIWPENLIISTRRPLDLETLASGSDFVSEFIRTAREARQSPDWRVSLLAELDPVYQHRRVEELVGPIDEEMLHRLIDEAEALGLDLLVGED